MAGIWARMGGGEEGHHVAVQQGVLDEGPVAGVLQVQPCVEREAFTDLQVLSGLRPQRGVLQLVEIHGQAPKGDILRRRAEMRDDSGACVCDVLWTFISYS